MRARVPRALACVAFLLCFALGRSSAKSLEGLPDLRILDMDRALTGGEAQELLDREAEEEEPAAVTLWGQLAGETAENPDLSRQARVEVLLLRGSSGRVATSSAPLTGDDAEGCLLSESAAQALFGSGEPVGGQVSWAGRTLTVRGIAAGEEPLLLARAGDRDPYLDHLTLQPPPGNGTARFLEAFRQRRQLAGRWNTPGLWAGLARAGSLLPAWVMLLSVVFPLIRGAFAAGRYPARFLACLLAAGGVWFFLLWAVEFSLQIPTELLPGKWSDFDFWGRLYQDARRDLRAFLAAEKTEVHLAVLLPALRACGLGAAAALLFPAALGRARPRGRELWLGCAGMACFCFFASVRLDPALAGDRALWACPAGYLGAAAGARWLIAWAGEDPGEG